MVFHTYLPKNLTAVPGGHGELQRVMVGVLLSRRDRKKPRDEYTQRKEQERRFQRCIFISTYRGVCSQLDKESPALEAEFANLGPVEGIDFSVPLKKRRKCNIAGINIDKIQSRMKYPPTVPQAVLISRLLNETFCLVRLIKPN